MLILNHRGNVPPKKNLKKKCYSPLVTPTKGTTMLNEPVLLNDWDVVAYAPSLSADKPRAVRLLEEDLVLWRTSDKIHAWRDLCVHRGTRLSLGKIQGETLMCAY